MSVAIIGAVVGVGTAVYGIAEGSNQKRRARHQLEALEKSKPVDKIPEEILQNQQLASLRSKTGLPSEQYAMAQKAIQRQQARTLRAAMDRKMGLGLLGTIDDNAQRAQQNLDVENAKARMGNEKVLMNTNTQVANWKKGIFDRELNKWERDYDYSMGLKGQGNQNIANGITSGLNATGAIIGRYGSNSNWANGLFGRRKTPTVRSPYSGGMADSQGGY